MTDKEYRQARRIIGTKKARQLKIREEHLKEEGKIREPDVKKLAQSKED